ncbi:transglycosylase SLT domain-containing protein [Candidatus Binatia bacterium]|nr:transglycosylase SLT domain-containing protein [Candidatus Binatia bacterium]
MLLPHLMQVQVTRRPAEVAGSRAGAPAPGAGSLRSTFASELGAVRSGFIPLTAADRVASTARSVGARSSGSPTAAPMMSAHEPIAAWLTTPRQRALANAITRASDHAGVASDVSLAVAVAESSLDAAAQSTDGLSSGTFQVTGPTAADIRRRIRDGEIARPPGSDDVALGVAHLRWLDDIFDRGETLSGSLRTVPVRDGAERTRFAVAAYNAGEGRVARAQEQAAAQRRDPTRYENIRAFLPSITQRYVDRVMRYSGRATPTVRTA